MTEKLTYEQFWDAVRSGRKNFSGCDLTDIPSLTSTCPEDFYYSQYMNPTGMKATWSGFDFIGATFREAEGWCNGLDASFARGNGLKGFEVRGINLSKAIIPSFKAGYSDFRGVNMSQSVMTWSWFCYSDLSAVNFQGANLFQTDMVLAKAVGTDFRGAVLWRGTLPYLASGADFRGAIMPESCINLDYVGSRFDNADLRCASLGNSNLAGASFKGADLSGANLSWANLCGADFTDAIFDTGTNFDSAYVNDKTKWPAFRFQKWWVVWKMANFRQWTRKDQAEFEQKKAEQEAEFEKNLGRAS